MNKTLDLFTVTQSINIVEAMKHIDANGKGILFVVNEEMKLIGCLTDGDIRRWIIRTGDLQQNIGDIMNTSPLYIENGERWYAAEMIEKHRVKAIPIINEDRILLDIVFAKEFSTTVKSCDVLKRVPVIIMAGGKGSRLYPFTKILPKPLIPICGIPIVERILNRFCEFGAESFYMTVNYKKEMIKSYFSETEYKYNISYVEEGTPLGTAGSIRLIDKHFKEPVIVTNCDILIQASYGDIYDYHIKSHNDITIVGALKNIVIPYGILYSKENGIVTSMEEKPNLSYFVNTGMYIVNGNILEKIPKNTVFHMTDLVDVVMQEGCKVGMYPVSEDSFLDMGEFEEMNRMEEKLNLK